MNAQPPSRDRDHGAVSSRAGSSLITKPATLAKAALLNSSRRGLFKIVTAPGLSMASLRPQSSPPKLEDRRAPFPDVQDQDQNPNGKSQKEAIAQSEHEKALKDAEELASLSNELSDDIKKRQLHGSGLGS
jgi:hypothetical protein